jgi:HEAT repeat protein
MLRGFPERIPLPDLERLAGDPLPKVRLRALQALGARRGPGVTAVIEQGLDDPEPMVRTYACRALGDQGGDRAEGLLDRVLQDDPSWYVRNAAYQARSSIRPEAKQAAVKDCP